MGPLSVADRLRLESIIDINDASSVLRVPRRIEVILMDECIEGLLAIEDICG
jgi:hypothetical protein